MTTSPVTIEDRLAELERLIDDHRRRSGTYRPRRAMPRDYGMAQR